MLVLRPTNGVLDGRVARLRRFSPTLASIFPTGGNGSPRKLSAADVADSANGVEFFIYLLTRWLPSSPMRLRTEIFIANSVTKLGDLAHRFRCG